MDRNSETDQEDLVVRTEFGLGWPRNPAAAPPQAKGKPKFGWRFHDKFRERKSGFSLNTWVSIPSKLVSYNSLLFFVNYVG